MNPRRWTAPKPRGYHEATIHAAAAPPAPKGEKPDCRGGEKGATMGLDFAIEELYATGWTALDSSGCKHQGGRAYPTLDRVRREFAEAGFDLAIRHIQLFDTYRAEWRDGQGQPRGGVIGKSEAEVAVYALSRLRRELVGA